MKARKIWYKGREEVKDKRSENACDEKKKIESSI